MDLFKDFREIIVFDAEFTHPPGENPTPICLCWAELRSGRRGRLWHTELGPAPPYDIGPDVLLVAYAGNAEVGFHLACGWSAPACLYDALVEFKLLTCDKEVPAGRGLLGALTYYGLDGMAAAEKSSMHDLAIRGAPFTDEEREALLDYCAQDVEALATLLPCLLDDVTSLPAVIQSTYLGSALWRGRYICALSKVERNGVPVDAESLELLRSEWAHIKAALIAEVDADFEVFDKLTFKLDKLEAYLERNGIPWPRTPIGRLATDKETFKKQSTTYPQLEPLRELRLSLAQMRRDKVAMGRMPGIARRFGPSLL
jgi:hypothetical protein